MSSKPTETDTSFWDQRRGRIRSRKGGWLIGQGVYSHGYNVMEDLVGKYSYFQVMVLNALGFMPERRFTEWMEAVFICLSWPDPRIWCNQIGALGGTSRASVIASTSAGILAADSFLYGMRPMIDGVRFIQTAQAEHKAGKSAEEIVAAEVERHRGKLRIMGYARPIASGDERVEAMEEVRKQLAYPIGEHLALALEIEAVVQRDFNESININGYGSAFLSDQGLSAEQVYLISTLLVSSGITACYAETYSQAADSFLPLRCDDIDYQGNASRPVPED